MDWHARYVQQANWTKQLRLYLFNKAGLKPGQRTLEVGCGTGAVMMDFPVKVAGYGLDVSFQSLEETARHVPEIYLTCGDGMHLPYKDSAFDMVFCHYLLLWVRDAQKVVAEMVRVTHPGGVVLALAEPDYGGRIDYPAHLAEIGRWQSQALQSQGADPEMGRKLSGIFMRAGLREVQSGVIGGEWRARPSSTEVELEWQVLMEDMANRVSRSQIDRMQRMDKKARDDGERVLYVPTFYAWGVV